MNARLASSEEATIGLLDSGLGGLSVYAAVAETLPQARYLYLADHGFFPYGTKPAPAVAERVSQLALDLIDSYRLDLFIVACNTASTIALPGIRAATKVPVIGVVPAIKPAVALTSSRVLGLLATPGTVMRDYTEDLIRQFAADCEIIKVGSDRLVQIAEDKLAGRAVDRTELAAILAPLLAHPRLDTVILACTHFPHLRSELMAALPRAVHWVDSGAAIARRASELLLGRPSSGTSSQVAENTLLFTGNTLLSQPSRALWQERFGFTSVSCYPADPVEP